MVSRRNVLATLGAGISVATAGCVAGAASFLGGAMRNEDGLTFVEKKNRGDVIYRYEVDLDEGEYDYDVLELPGDLPIYLTMDIRTGSAHGMVVSEREFENNYQEDGIRGIFTINTEEEGWSSDRGSAGGSSMWYVIADNTDYLDHEPQGHAEGRLGVTTR